MQLLNGEGFCGSIGTIQKPMQLTRTKMKLEELIKSVKEEHLDKDQLEHYHSELCYLKAQLKLEFAELKKKKAVYLLGREKDESVVSREISWGASKEGQRKFEIEGYIGSTTALIEGVKARLYNQY